MLNIMSNTCVTFRSREAADKDWVEIKTSKDQGCSARVR
jgi:hypothetical protein